MLHHNPSGIPTTLIVPDKKISLNQLVQMLKGSVYIISSFIQLRSLFHTDHFFQQCRIDISVILTRKLLLYSSILFITTTQIVPAPLTSDTKFLVWMNFTLLKQIFYQLDTVLDNFVHCLHLLIKYYPDINILP